MMDEHEIALFESTIGDIVAEFDGAELTDRLDAFGWREVLADEPRVAIRALFEAQGRLGRWSASLHDVLGRALDALGVSAPGRACVVLPRPRSAAPARRRGDHLQIDGLLLGARHPHDSFILEVDDGSGPGTVAIVAADALTMEPRRGLDPALDVVAVAGTTDAFDIVAENEHAASWWCSAESLARLAVSHCIVGALASMFVLARDHANDREQFGRAIGTFQVVRHKLAEVFVAIEAATAATAAAWDADESVLAAATAKLVVSQSTATVVTHTQQILAGIGFTAEHPYHSFMKRAVTLDRILGAEAELADVVGAELLRRRRAPRLVEL
jgi:hypothetical protein